MSRAQRVSDGMFGTFCVSVRGYFAPLFNDCLVSLKSYSVSLQHSKGEFMFTKKEKRPVGEGDFTIIRETESRESL